MGSGYIRRSWFSSLAALWASGLLGCATASRSADLLGDPVVTIPFDLTEAGGIAVPVTLGERDEAVLMLHTAVEGVFLTRDALERLSSVVLDGSATATSWGGQAEVRFSSSNSLRIGELTWEDLEVTEDEHSGPGTDGKFGLDLFEGRAVELDFEDRQIRLHESPQNPTNGWSELEAASRPGSIYLTGEVELPSGSRVSHEFLMHSGFAGALLLDDEFVGQHDWLASLEVVRTSELRDSLGNVLPVRHVELPALIFGGLELRDVPIGLFEGNLGRSRISVLGSDLLRRFDWWISAGRDRVFVRSNEPTS